MASERNTYALTELYDIGSGLSKPGKDFGSGDGFLTFKDVFDNYFVPETLSGLVQSTPQEQAKCSICRGDVFLTRTSETQAELGMSSVALRDYPRATFNGFTKRLRPKKHDMIIPEYAAYYFRSLRFRNAVTSMSSLSTRASLNNEMLSRLSIDLPPLEEQKAISYILKSLDDKIELNRSMNTTLETMARALFKSWFVDFDPVRAKLQGRQPTGMDPATAELFPSEFEKSELGPIPKGWRIVPLKEFATLSTQSVAPYKFPDRLYKHYSIPAYDDGKMPVCDRGASIKSNKYMVMESAVLISKLNPCTPRTWIPRDSVENSICSTEFMQFVPGDPGERSFLYCLMNSQPMLDRVASHVTGSTGSRQRAQPSAIANLGICLPHKKLLHVFNQLTSPLLNLVASNLDEQQLLADTRATLLPVLLNGISTN